MSQINKGKRTGTDASFKRTVMILLRTQNSRPENCPKGKLRRPTILRNPRRRVHVKRETQSCFSTKKKLIIKEDKGKDLLSFREDISLMLSENLRNTRQNFMETPIKRKPNGS